MLEPFAADVLHELLEAWNAGDGAVPEGVERIIGQFAFADIGADASVGVGGGDATVGQQAGRSAAVEGAVGVFDAERAAEDRGVRDLDVRKKTLGPVAAMEEHALSSSSA
jgi:hypothetical protein